MVSFVVEHQRRVEPRSARRARKEDEESSRRWENCLIRPATTTLWLGGGSMWTQGRPRSSANPGLGVSTPLALAGQEPDDAKPPPSTPASAGDSHRRLAFWRQVWCGVAGACHGNREGGCRLGEGSRRVASSDGSSVLLCLLAADPVPDCGVAIFGTFRFARIRSLLCGFEAWRLFGSVPCLWTERVGKAAKPQSLEEGRDDAFRSYCAPAPQRENQVSGFRRKGTCLAQRCGGAEEDGTANGWVLLRLLAILAAVRSSCD